jgi:ATP-dependent RNA helicase DeaD
MVIITRSESRKIGAIERKIQQKFISKKIPTGIEICEIQLYHLANRIRNTKINKEVSNYLPAINDVLEGLDRDELIQKIVSVEFTRFFNYYNRTKDLNTSEGDRGNKRDNDFQSDSGSVRYFINIGERDGYDWMSLKDFLKDTLSLGKDDLYKVDVKESFAFFNADTQHKDLILKTFTNFKVDGRFINVEVSDNPGGGGRKRRRDSKDGRKSNDSYGDRSRDKGRGKKRDSNFSKGGGGSRRSGASSSSGRRSKKRDGFY